jgi:hypothetical protein
MAHTFLTGLFGLFIEALRSVGRSVARHHEVTRVDALERGDFDPVGPAYRSHVLELGKISLIIITAQNRRSIGVLQDKNSVPKIAAAGRDRNCLSGDNLDRDLVGSTRH